MLTLDRNLFDFGAKAATHRQRSRRRRVASQFATAEELALGADEAGLLGRLLTVEPDLGHRAVVACRLWHVILH
jgi:hypothetical protein